MADHEAVAVALTNVVWPELISANICGQLTVSEIHAVTSGVAAQALQLARQQLIAVAQGRAQTAESDGEGVVADIETRRDEPGLPEPDAAPAEEPEPDEPEE